MWLNSHAGTRALARVDLGYRSFANQISFCNYSGYYIPSLPNNKAILFNYTYTQNRNEKYLFVITILITFTCSAQKIRVQNLKLVSYDITSSKNLKINSYSTIDHDGRLNIFVNGNHGPAYYAAQLSDDEIEAVNKLTAKDLQSFVKTKKLSAGMHYAGDRDFISFNKSKN